MADNWGHCTHVCSHVLRTNVSRANTVQAKTTTLGDFWIVPVVEGEYGLIALGSHVGSRSSATA